MLIKNIKRINLEFQFWLVSIDKICKGLLTGGGRIHNLLVFFFWVKLVSNLVTYAIMEVFFFFVMD